MTYQDLTQQDYVNLRKYSTNITTWLRELIEINDKQEKDIFDSNNQERLKERISQALMSEQNTLRKIGKLPNANDTIKTFLERLKADTQIPEEAKIRLYYRLEEALSAKQAKNISVSELGITDLTWQYQTFTLKEIITARLGILLITSLDPCVKCDIRLFDEPINFSSDATKKLYEELKNSILKIITTSPCLELLYTLYKNDIDITLFDQIESTFKGSNEIKRQFEAFINSTYKTLSPHTNYLGEITFNDDPKDIISLLEKLLLLEILIPQMTDNTLMHFKTQLSWGINIKGEKQKPVFLLYSIDNELKKRGLLDKNSLS